MNALCLLRWPCRLLACCHHAVTDRCLIKHDFRLKVSSKNGCFKWTFGIAFTSYFIVNAILKGRLKWMFLDKAFSQMSCVIRHPSIMARGCHKLCSKLHTGPIVHCVLHTTPHPRIQYITQVWQLQCSVLD